MADQTGMQPATPQAAPAVPVVNQVKQLLSQDKIKEKFGEVLGQKAPQFMASITNTAGTHPPGCRLTLSVSDTEIQSPLSLPK